VAQGRPGDWRQARYNAWEMMPGVFIFGHLLEATENHDGHIVVADLDAGLATNYHGFVNTPYFANEAGRETLFGKIVGQGIPDPGSKRHERTRDLLGRAFTWEYSPGSTRCTSTRRRTRPRGSSRPPTATSPPSGAAAATSSRSATSCTSRAGRKEACNGTLGTVLINMRTMHDAGHRLSLRQERRASAMSAVGAPGAARRARSTSTSISRQREGQLTWTRSHHRPPARFLKTGASCRRAAGDRLRRVAALAGRRQPGEARRLEDERAGRGACSASSCATSTAPRELRRVHRRVGAVDWVKGCARSPTAGREARSVLADDGRSATARCACRVERETEFDGDSTLEQMARFQGQGSHRFAEERVLATEFVKGKDGWRIAARASPDRKGRS
jgi:hypothetical protein